MGFNRKKYTRVTLDLTHAEFRRLHEAVTEKLANKSVYIRAAIEEKIQAESKDGKAGKLGKAN